MKATIGRTAVVVALLASTSLPVSAQRVAERHLEPETEFAEPFSRIRGLHELSDGRVLIADQREVAVYLIDFAARTKVLVGREGAGPREYGTPVGLVPLRGDSSLLVDLDNRRIAVLGPDGEITGTFASRQFGYFMGGTRGDLNGHILFDSRVSTSARDGRPLMRWRRPEQRLDTLTVLAPSESFVFEGRDWPVPWSVGDIWSADASGRVAVVRRDPYRVEWIEPDGTVRRPGPVDYTPIRIPRADKRAWNERPQTGMVSTRGSRVQRPREWPFTDHFPPFVFRGATITPEGALWVERKQSQTEERPLFDVIDAAGLLVARVRFPARRDIVGFGPATVYATREDADGLLWLERYRR